MMSQSPMKDSVKGIQWFKHFPTNFVRPYGATVAPSSDETIWKRLQTFNCEHLQRPKVAVSKLAGSIEENLTSLLNCNYSLINEKKVKKFIEHIQPLLDALKPLEKGSNTTLNEKHVVELLRQFFQEYEERLNIMNEAFVIGSSLYTMSIQFLVARAIFHDPDNYACVLPPVVEGAKAFKQNPSVKGLKQFLVDNIVSNVKTCSPSKAKASSMLAELEDSDDDHESIDIPKPLSANLFLDGDSDDDGDSTIANAAAVQKKQSKKGEKRVSKSEHGTAEEEGGNEGARKRKKHKKHTPALIYIFLKNVFACFVSKYLCG